MSTQTKPGVWIVGATMLLSIAVVARSDRGLEVSPPDPPGTALSVAAQNATPVGQEIQQADDLRREIQELKEEVRKLRDRS